MAQGKSGRGGAATKGSGRGAATKTKNETPNTPDVAESKIARMKAGELRKRLKDRGVKGTAGLKKPELVKKLTKAYVSDAKKDAKKSAKAADSASTPTKAAGGKKSVTAAKGGGSGKGRTSGNDTPNTPGVAESEIARMKVGELRKRLKDRGVKGTAELKKPELVKRLVKEYTADAKRAGGGKAAKAAKSDGGKAAKAAKSDGGKAAKAAKSDGGKAAKSGGGKPAKAAKSGGGGTAITAATKQKKSGGVRTGAKTSRSLRYSQEIDSPADEPERPGRSLVTTDHEVIRRWAEARNGVPATVEGTEHGEHLGVLRFDFPGGDGGDRLRQVTWEEWFDTFDDRRLNFIYQEERSDGRPSTFFRLESPHREDA